MKNMKAKLLAVAVAVAMPALAAAANVAVSVQQIVKSALTQTYTSSGLLTTNTYQFTNEGRVFLHFKKTGAGNCTVTITTQGTLQGYAVTDQTVTVPATTGDVMVGPFAPSLFNDASELVSFTISDTVGLSFAALRL